ncbi:hypothetical protein GCM10022239_09870 [Leifsonia bigeumensis]|uniref:SAF domain-containing protein n=2 Tax=Leifsonella bigeumensis TaxID=433643 RepID=A0ABP7FEU1_9MICO
MGDSGRDPGWNAGAVRPARQRRPFRFDPRLAIGVVMVVASVVGVYAVVVAADRSVLVYAATSTVNPGDRIYIDDLQPTSVRLGEAAGRYLLPEDVPAEGLLVTRSVAAGELVPASAVGSAASIRFASVVASVSGRLSKAIAPGAVVDVWSAVETDHGVFGPPVVLVGSATIVRVVDAGGLIADGGGEGVEVLVPRDRIARVLEATANGDAVSLVPVSIPAGR